MPHAVHAAAAGWSMGTGECAFGRECLIAVELSDEGRWDNKCSESVLRDKITPTHRYEIQRNFME